MKIYMERGKILPVMLIIILYACSDDPAGPDFSGIPEQLNDGWEVSEISEFNVDPLSIDTLSNKFRKGDYGEIHSFLLIRQSTLIYEAYYNGINTQYINPVKGVTKSITAALLGIVLDQGLISGTECRISDLLPEYQELFNSDPQKQKITLQHLLTMTAGFEWTESSVTEYDESNDHYRGQNSIDYIEYILSKPVVSEPGDTWNYNSGCSILIGKIIEKATGMKIDKFAEENLFDLLGITNYEWTEDTERKIYKKIVGG